jgi:hypothetical protein
MAAVPSVRFANRESKRVLPLMWYRRYMPGVCVKQTAQAVCSKLLSSPRSGEPLTVKASGFCFWYGKGDICLEFALSKREALVANSQAQRIALGRHCEGHSAEAIGSALRAELGSFGRKPCGFTCP